MIKKLNTDFERLPRQKDWITFLYASKEQAELSAETVRNLPKQCERVTN